MAESVGGSHDTSILLCCNTLAFIFLGCPGAETMDQQKSENPLKFIVTLIKIFTQLFLYEQKLVIKHNKGQSFPPVKFFATMHN